MSAPADRTVGALAPWDTEWAAERAAEALRYLATHYPECLDALRVLDEHETAAHEAAMRWDRDAYHEALRAYMRADRDAALRIRWVAARNPRLALQGSDRAGLEMGQRPWVARRPYDGPETL